MHTIAVVRVLLAQAPRLLSFSHLRLLLLLAAWNGCEHFWVYQALQLLAPEYALGYFGAGIFAFTILLFCLARILVFLVSSESLAPLSCRSAAQHKRGDTNLGVFLLFFYTRDLLQDVLGLPHASLLSFFVGNPHIERAIAFWGIDSLSIALLAVLVLILDSLCRLCYRQLKNLKKLPSRLPKYRVHTLLFSSALLAALLVYPLWGDLGVRPTHRVNIAALPYLEPLQSTTRTQEGTLAVYRQHKPAGPKDRIIIWGESAMPQQAERGRILENIQDNYLESEETLIFGSNRLEFGAEQNDVYNAAFLLPRDPFIYQIYKKALLVPFAEYTPTFASWPVFDWLGLAALTAHPYSPGHAAPLEHRGINFAVGICFETFFDRWYTLMEEQGVAVYVALHREYLFSDLGRWVLYLASWAQAQQSGKTFVRVSDGGHTAIWSPFAMQTIQSDSGLQKKVFLGQGTSFYRQQHHLILLATLCLLMALCWSERRNKA